MFTLCKCILKVHSDRAKANEKANVLFDVCRFFSVFSCASAKAEGSLSSLSCMCVYVDQNKETPPEMAFLLGIP